jgi:hypothetical protein
MIEGQEQWEVEKIAGRRLNKEGRHPQREYLVKWKNCGHEENQWIKRRELLLGMVGGRPG